MPHKHAQTHVFNARRILRGDPTRTLTISRRFIADINRRIKKLNREITNFIATLDVFGLGERPRPKIIGNIEPREYEFVTDPRKLEIFREWLDQQIREGVLSISPGDYIDSAYKRGIINAYLSSKSADLANQLGVGDQTAEEFLRSSFAAPERLDKVRLLSTRAYEQLRGFTGQMASETNRLLAQGMADGSSPRTIARQMTNRISGITRNRAHTIARTEIINAHANGQLDTFEDLGVKELGVKAEWLTAGDERVCPDCAEQEGNVFDVEEARGLIPFHPNCRCTWIPFVPDP